MKFWLRRVIETQKAGELEEKYFALKERLFDSLLKRGYERCETVEGLTECGIPAKIKRGDVYLATEPQGGGVRVVLRIPYDARPDGYFKSAYISGILGPVILQNKRSIFVTEENILEKLTEILETTGRGEAIAYFNRGKKVLAGNR